MQTFYTLLVHIQVVVMVQIENFKVWKRCEITIKQYKIVCIELAGCMSYGSSPYENTRDQINKYISIWVNRPTNISSTQMSGPLYTISRELFPSEALIFIFYIQSFSLTIFNLFTVRRKLEDSGCKKLFLNEVAKKDLYHLR